MSPMKILASLTLPINSMVAFRLEGGGFGMISIGWGSASALVQAPCSFQVLRGGSAVSPPSGSLKALSFKHSDTHDAYALTLGNYSTKLVLIISPSGLGLVVSGCITILTAALPLGSLTTSAGTLHYSCPDPYWNSVTGFFQCILSSFYSCHKLLLHFNQLWPGILCSDLGVCIVISAWSDNAWLTTPN